MGVTARSSKFLTAPMTLPSSQPQTPESLSYRELAPADRPQRWREIATVFLRLGVMAFGGPVAHIAMMDDEVVNRRQWMSRERLLDLLGVTNLIPGPNSTELAIYIGYDRGGWPGLAIAGTCFILPAMGIVWVLAALYTQFQTVPQVGWLLYGIKPVIIAIVIQALWKLGKKALKDRPTALVAIAVIVLFSLGLNEILLLGLAGVGVMLFKNLWRGQTTSALLFPLSGLVAQVSNPTTIPLSTTPATLGQTFLFFLKVGSVLYGSGYVLLAFLQRDLVDRMGWITSQQLLDAVAIGQFTPGPIFTTATFVGYLMAGNLGAIVATIGIFLPSFLLVGLISPLASQLRRSPWASAFLDGVNAASLGLIAVVTVQLGQSALIDWLTIAVALVSLVLTFRTKLNSAWLVLGGAIIGYLFQQLGT